jgi:hypothetical protein
VRILINFHAFTDPYHALRAILKKKTQRKNLGLIGSKFSNTAIEPKYFAVTILILSLACLYVYIR